MLLSPLAIDTTAMMRFAILLAAAHALVATTHLQQRASKRFMSTCAEPAINYDAWLEEAGIGGKFAIDGDGVRATADIDGLEVVATVPEALALARVRRVRARGAQNSGSRYGLNTSTVHLP